jgi:hypothetical protein
MQEHSLPVAIIEPRISYASQWMMNQASENNYLSLATSE